MLITSKLIDIHDRIKKQHRSKFKGAFDFSQEQNTEIANVNKKPKIKQRGSEQQIRKRIVRSSAARFGAVEFAEDVEGGDEADEAEAHHQHHRR